MSRWALVSIWARCSAGTTSFVCKSFRRLFSRNGIFLGSLGCPPSSSDTTNLALLRRPLLPLLESLLPAVSIMRLELDDLCGVRSERPIVAVLVPNELVGPMALGGSVANVMHYGR